MSKPYIQHHIEPTYFDGQMLPEFLLEVEDGDIDPRFDMDWEDRDD